MTTLANGVRSIQIQFSSGSMTVSCIKESATFDKIKIFASAIGLFTNKTVTAVVVSDKEKQEIVS